MSHESNVAEHYSHGSLLESIQNSISKLGKTPASINIEDLAPVDEFHIGGREASERFLSQLNFTDQKHILDIGCGLGGAARFVAHRYKSRVTGIDLTTEYIETGKALCSWLRLDKQVHLEQGSALAMPFVDASFDGAYMMHVGMNIADKTRLFSEIYRVLRPGSSFGVYDVMRVGEGQLHYPVPWATLPETSALATPVEYQQALRDAGFRLNAEHNRRDFAVRFFEALQAKNQAGGGLPALGLHILMGASTGLKIQNMIANINAGIIAPIELHAHKG